MNGRRSLTKHSRLSGDEASRTPTATPTKQPKLSSEEATPTQRFLAASAARRPRTRHTSEPPTLPVRLRYGPGHAVLVPPFEEETLPLGSPACIGTWLASAVVAVRGVTTWVTTWVTWAASRAAAAGIDARLGELALLWWEFALVWWQFTLVWSRRALTWWRCAATCALAALVVYAYVATNLAYAPKPDRGALDIYHASCPPSFLYHASLTLPDADLNPLLGLPPRLFPTWSPPRPVVDAQLRRLQLCWHTDKAAQHCRGRRTCAVDVAHLKAVGALHTAVHAAWKQRQPTFCISQAVLGVGDGDPKPFLHHYRLSQGELRKLLDDRRKPVDISHLATQQPLLLNTSLPAFDAGCAARCGLVAQTGRLVRRALVPYPWQDVAAGAPTLADVGRREHCVCMLDAASMLRTYWSLIPPRNHPLWADPTLAALPLFSLKGILWRPLRALASFSSNADLAHEWAARVVDDTQKRWVKTGWSENADFDRHTVEGRAKHRAQEVRWRARRDWEYCIREAAAYDSLGFGLGSFAFSRCGDEVEVPDDADDD
ncbi:hypothetical protein P153DRAFT_361874 [Dothidotthia symphoricarpi CBS 119687]|uniref:Uncharacterized protein n=1 Tax=Dothidotthia symphoricarpi CBS 119687 TaxID=1392245 RepID=A0A6A5ZXZ1_9PLEO|nr:uncharacterized protein P153DRAFT_361874 [Dothidotthia symphoricarpi CBS 119687]KAF2123637.1 hypothetical protein P153DRAFT_361874 [Dothidotthia symphoricarpi CBS 119687]